MHDYCSILATPLPNHFSTFCGFFVGSNQYRAMRVYGLCVFFFIFWEHLKAQAIVVLEKPDIKPVNPGLQGIALKIFTTQRRLLTIFYLEKLETPRGSFISRHFEHFPPIFLSNLPMHQNMFVKKIGLSCSNFI